jgi:ABC-type polar amino acid transport system ATPase subunit
MNQLDAQVNGPVLKVDSLHKAYGALEVLRGVSLEVERGQTVVIIGPSGSGKSTLLRCINRLVDPEAGTIVVAGIDMTSPQTNLPKARRHIGLVSQHFNLYPHLTAVENVMLAPRIVLGVPEGAAKKKALDLLGRVGLSDKIDVHPRQLSGGQQQRVAIARALAMDPALMLFDEPTSALDPELTTEVLDVMKKLADDGMTMVVVSHEMHFAARVADRIVMIDNGLVIEEGPPREFFSRPSNERTKRFLSQLLAWETESGEELANAATDAKDAPPPAGVVGEPGPGR